jgi:hypothetical protein
MNAVTLTRPLLVAATRSYTQQYCTRQVSCKPLALRLMGACERHSVPHIKRRLFSAKEKSSGGPKTPPKMSVDTASKEATESTSGIISFWKWYTGPKHMPERWTLPWYREMVLICTVFAITGSSTMVLVRPAVSKGLGLKGSLKDGPWSYRICSIVVMTPIYATLLVVVGTIFGRHQYFRHFSVKMWSRFGIPPEMLDETYHITKKNFRKW